MRTLIITVTLLLLSVKATGCDICGCSMGGSYLGILPQFHKNFVGFRYSEQSSWASHSKSRLASGIYESEERFRSYDLMTRFYPFNRLQAVVLLPYLHFNKTEDETSTQTNGLGDVTLMANYLVFDTGDSLKRNWRQTITIGGGAKLPTGNYSQHNSDGTLLNPNLQTGSGSVDFLAALSYTLRYRRWGFIGSAQGRLNTANKNNYQFGNRVNGSVSVFYWQNIKRFSLLPNIGAFTDWSLPNYDGNSEVEGTGGHISLATAGVDLYFGRFSAGFTYQHPIEQELGAGKVKGRDRFLATLNYIF